MNTHFVHHPLQPPMSTKKEKCCERCYQILKTEMTSTANDDVVTDEQVQCSDPFCTCHSQSESNEDGSTVTPGLKVTFVGKESGIEYELIDSKLVPIESVQSESIEWGERQTLAMDCIVRHTKFFLDVEPTPAFVNALLGDIDTLVKQAITTAVAKRDAKIAEAFKETRNSTYPDEMHCGCLNYCEWIINGRPDDGKS